MAGHPPFVTVRWDDLVNLLDDPDSDARHYVSAAMQDAYDSWLKEQERIACTPTCTECEPHEWSMHTPVEGSNYCLGCGSYCDGEPKEAE